MLVDAGPWKAPSDVLASTSSKQWLNKQRDAAIQALAEATVPTRIKFEAVPKHPCAYGVLNPKFESLEKQDVTNKNIKDYAEKSYTNLEPIYKEEVRGLKKNLEKLYFG